jgi:predicted RND superfamily exporter protein
MDMVTMVTANLGMVEDLTTTLLVTLVMIIIQVGVVQGDAYWTFMPILPMVHPVAW